MDREIQIWPDWELKELIGEGSFGSVYRASHLSNPGLTAAVKIIHIPTEEEETKALRQEGMTDAEIRTVYKERVSRTLEEIQWLIHYKGSPHIVSLEDFRVIPNEDGFGAAICLRMEMLKSLREYVSDKKLDEEEVLQIGIHICRALEECHADGILHRDVKPDNIFVQEQASGNVIFKLGDFGSAGLRQRENDSGQIQGALAYLAPEIAENKNADERSDLYSLGLTLYRFMNENRLPFLPAKRIVSHEDQTVAVRMRMQGMPLPPPSQASEEFVRIIQKACAAEPESRYQSAAGMRTDLEHALEKTKRARMRKTRREKWHKWRKRFDTPIINALAVLLILVMGGMIVFFLTRPSGRDATEKTERPMLMVSESGTQNLQIAVNDYLKQFSDVLGDAGTKGRYPVPRSLDALGSTGAFSKEVPKVVETENGLMIDTKGIQGEWDVMAQYNHGSTVSYLKQEDGYYRSAEKNDLREQGILTITCHGTGKENGSLDYCYELPELIPSFSGLIFYEPEKGRSYELLYESLQEEKKAKFCISPENGGRMEVHYDRKGRMEYAVMGTARWETEEELAEMKGVVIFP